MQRRGRLGARLRHAFQSASLGRSPFPARPTELAVGLALARYGRITARFAPAATWTAVGSPARRLMKAAARRGRIEQPFDNVPLVPDASVMGLTLRRLARP